MPTAKISAGLLMHRQRRGQLEVFLAHPGGPFFARKDDGAWSIPKGLVEAGEDPLQAAMREFGEETGIAPQGPFVDLGEVRQKSGKTVKAWAFAGDLPAGYELRSNTFTMEWPRGSGRVQAFPEIDRAQFFDLAQARVKINAAQVVLLDRLLRALP